MPAGLGFRGALLQVWLQTEEMPRGDALGVLVGILHLVGAEERSPGGLCLFCLLATGYWSTLVIAFVFWSGWGPKTFLGSVWEVGGDRVVEEIMYVLCRLSRWTGSI